MKIERKHVKTGLSLTSQVSVGFVVQNVIRATMPIGASPINRIACFIGSIVISGVLNKPVKDFTDDLVDGFADGLQNKEVKLVVVS